MEKYTIGVFVGSLRKGSYTRQVAENVMGMMPGNFDMRLIEIGELAMFNQDFDDEGRTPAAWKAFRDQVRAMDGYIFFTPEYNRSVPAVLKNAIDIASRPYGQNAWGEKPAAVMSVSPGGMGGFGANHHLRQTLTFLDVYTMQQPEAYVAKAADMLDADGKVSSDRSRKYLQGFADAFAQWVARLAK